MGYTQQIKERLKKAAEEAEKQKLIDEALKAAQKAAPKKKAAPKRKVKKVEE